jgi:hypothetical protein
MLRIIGYMFAICSKRDIVSRSAGEFRLSLVCGLSIYHGLDCHAQIAGRWFSLSISIRCRQPNRPAASYIAMMRNNVREFDKALEH